MRLTKTMVACIFTMLATACHHNDNPDPENGRKPDHTFLIYMAGDNSLTQYCKENVKLLKQGLLDATDDINLVIYKDNRDTGDALPVLFQLKRTYDKKTNAARIDTVYLERYSTEMNSCDPEVMAKVINKTFNTFDTKVKGLELWSHAMSWIPSDNFPTTRYVGQDNSNYTELWDVRKALEKCPKMDYICFDACFTGMAEVAHELDEVCDYIYAPITEIMGFGFPYNTMLPILASCKDNASVSKTLSTCVEDFSKASSFDRYGYTITLLETAKASALANAVAKLRKASKGKLEYIESYPYQCEADWQHYGRTVVGTRYYFYDLKDYVGYMAKDGSDELKNIVSEINDNNIVIAYANSDVFDDGAGAINLKGCKGLGVSVPELFNLSSKTDRLNIAYGMTKWGKALGF